MNKITAADVEGLEKLAASVLPVLSHDELDPATGQPMYAALTFGEHQSQAMTMAPNDWMALNSLPSLIAALRDAQAEVERLKASPKREMPARAMEIVTLANQYEGVDPKSSATIEIEVLRHAAMVVNGVDNDPLMQRFCHAAHEAGRRAGIEELREIVTEAVRQAFAERKIMPVDKPSRDKAIAETYRAGLSLRQTAEHHDCAVGTVRGALQRMGVPTRALPEMASKEPN